MPKMIHLPYFVSFLEILIFETKCATDIFRKYIKKIFLETQCRVLDNTMEATIKNPINCLKKGDLVHEPSDWAEFPESASSTRFYSGSVLQLGLGIIFR